jgi:hypothetical protein
VVDCTGLENRRLARAREFESHRFRQNAREYGAFELIGPACPHVGPHLSCRLTPRVATTFGRQWRQGLNAALLADKKTLIAAIAVPGQLAEVLQT